MLIAAAGTNQTPSVRTTATAFSFDAATNVLTVTSTRAQYADIAERYLSDYTYEPGTVVEFGGSAEVTIANTDMSKQVAGVVTTNPAYLMNAQLTGKYIVDVALQGRVPTKIIGPVGKGAIVVAAGAGKARAEENPEIGTVLGKSLENFTATPEKFESIIEVVIGKS